jgi:hypothetical protein
MTALLVLWNRQSAHNSKNPSRIYIVSVLARRDLNYRIYTIYVYISFDAAKNVRNIATRGISFEQALAFEWDSALIVADTRAKTDFRQLD